LEDSWLLKCRSENATCLKAYMKRFAKVIKVVGAEAK